MHQEPLSLGTRWDFKSMQTSARLITKGSWYSSLSTGKAGDKYPQESPFLVPEGRHCNGHQKGQGAQKLSWQTSSHEHKWLWDFWWVSGLFSADKCGHSCFCKLLHYDTYLLWVATETTGFVTSNFRSCMLRTITPKAIKHDLFQFRFSLLFHVGSTKHIVAFHQLES